MSAKLDRIGSITKIDDINCGRAEFMVATKILNTPEMIVTGSIEEFESERKSVHDTPHRIARILKIARGIAIKQGIKGGRISTSNEILNSLKTSPSMQIRGIAGYVENILNGPINSALDRDISPIIQEMQQDVPNGEKLTVLNVQILGRIQLGECCVGDLTKFFNTSSASMTELIKDIGEKGYLEKYSKTGPGEDKRKIYLRLTEKGKAFIAQVEEKLGK